MAALRIQKAREAGAAMYAADLLNEAEKALGEARDGLSGRGNYRTAVRAAAHACILADEARDKSLEEKRTISRKAKRLLRECRALIEEARSVSAVEDRSAELDSYSTRIVPIQALFDDERPSEAYESALQLKNELLDFLKRLKRQVRPRS
jgi:hypothetical protein